jgi:hypothetical protein
MAHSTTNQSLARSVEFALKSTVKCKQRVRAGAPLFDDGAAIVSARFPLASTGFGLSTTAIAARFRLVRSQLTLNTLITFCSCDGSAAATSRRCRFVNNHLSRSFCWLLVHKSQFKRGVNGLLSRRCWCSSCRRRLLCNISTAQHRRRRCDQWRRLSRRCSGRTSGHYRCTDGPSRSSHQALRFTLQPSLQNDVEFLREHPVCLNLSRGRARSAVYPR